MTDPELPRNEPSISLRRDFLLASQTMSTQSDGFTLLGRKGKIQAWSHWLSLISDNFQWNKAAYAISIKKKSTFFSWCLFDPLCRFTNLSVVDRFINLSKWQVVHVGDILRTPCWHFRLCVIIDLIFWVLFTIHYHFSIQQADVYSVVTGWESLCWPVVFVNFSHPPCLYKW